jgi:hypothetical protein
MIERKRLLGLFEDGSIHVLEGDSLDELTAQARQASKNSAVSLSLRPDAPSHWL